MMLPPEIVYEVLTYQFQDLMSNDHPNNPEKFHSNLRIFLRSNLTVNKTFYHVCKVLIYRYLNFTSARGFYKLLETLRQSPELVRYVQVADFEELTSIGLGRTGEMNKSIKNLTNETLWEFLWLTRGSLREFLASEHIQGDLDERIINFLLKPGTILSVVDFCGSSHDKFTETFTGAVNNLYRDGQPIDYNYQITSLGLNDCTTIASSTLGKLLATLPELQKLDLGHTSIDDRTIINSLPHLKGLTHLSLSMCSQLTPRGVLEFFSYHPAVTDVDNSTTLQWLNVQVHPHSSSWSDVQLMFLLKRLCRYGHNKTLQYLNIGGLPLHLTEDLSVTKTMYYWQCQDTLHFIKLNFPHLKSLSIKDNNVPVPRLVSFLSPLQSEEIAEQRLKFLNVVNNAYINRWSIQDPTILVHSKSLCAIELSFDPWQQIEASNSRHEINCRLIDNTTLLQDPSKSQPVTWKCYIGSVYGRRHWLYKTDEYLNRGDIDTLGYLTNYDSQGNKIIDIFKQPDFLKFAQTKIMLGCGIVRQSSARRNLTYRDLNAPISQFFDKNRTIARRPNTPPIRIPVRPPGEWRLIDNENPLQEGEVHDGNLLNDNTLHSPDTSDAPPNSRIGLFWDRSMTNLSQSMQAYESDLQYLNDPELQRRRSQLSLFRGNFIADKDSLGGPQHRLASASFHTGSSIRDTTICDGNEAPNMTMAYRQHLEVSAEYTVFGCIERGMYRYYSLKT